MAMIRAFLSTVLIGALALVPGCASASGDDPQPATFTIYVRDHMNNEVIHTFHKEGFLNQDGGLTITYDELIGGNSGYANGFFAVREQGFGTVLGTSLGGGAANLDTTGATILDAYLLQANAGANYAGVLQDAYGGLVVPRHSLGERVDRDGQTGPDSVWITGLSNINGKLGYTGSIGLGGSDFGCGYGDCNGGDGYHDIAGLWIGVNAEKIGYDAAMIIRAISETGQFLTRSGNKVDFNSDAGKYALRAYMCFAD